jgi:phosphate transport system permease protein
MAQFAEPLNASQTVDITSVDSKTVIADVGFTWLVRVFAILAGGLIFGIALVIGRQALPSVQQFGLGFLGSQEWDVPNLLFGALPYIYGTLVSAAIALFLALPIGTAVAIVTTEDILPANIRAPIAFVVELIAAIPSVIIGLWGIFVLIPFLTPVFTWLHQSFGWIPLFGTEPTGFSMLTASIILTIMIIPTIAAITRDVFLAVPKTQRSASMALGATRWETIFRVMIPSSASGMLGANILALGRALGETMAVTMVIGNSAFISASLLDPGYTIAAVLANEFAEANDALHVGALMYLAMILFALTLAVNMLAVVMVRVLTKRK